ncbi:MAG: tyrosine-protein phosphatase [Clostridia bacterium]|nr:tyrosine-protein phosphatase [Clostridia bacterium]
MKKYKKLLVVLLALIISVSPFTISGCANSENDAHTPSSSEIVNPTDPNTSGSGSGEENEQSNPNGQDTPASDKVLFYFESDATKLHTDLQLAYLADTYDSVAKYANGTNEKSKPVPATIKWQTNGKATNCELKISEDESFNNFSTISVKSNIIEIYNLKANTRYYYTLSATVKGKTATSTVQTFVTSSVVPRFIDCDGITNMRDLGGYSVRGGEIKQGLIYRCGRLNQSDTNVVKPIITAKGIETMRRLGIKTEIDLRMDKVYSDGASETGRLNASLIGEDVNYYNCPMDVMAGVSNSINYGSIRQVFAYLADENNYPLIFHCTIGTDRTGFIAYLLSGVLGVEKEGLLRDYLFSNFGNIGESRSESSISDLYVKMLDNQVGATLSEKIENYLVNTVGVQQEQIAAIRAILITTR